MSTLRMYRRIRAYLRVHSLPEAAAELASRILRRLRLGDLPPTIHVEISNVCNLSCEYCVLNEQSHTDRIMSERTFAAVLPYLRDARRIDVSGLAEPLMNTRWPAILQAARDAAPRAHIAMCSNATMLTEERSELLATGVLDELVFSLDGVDAALVDKVRQGGSLTEMLENIRTLQAVKARTATERPELNATVVLQRTNAAQLPAILELAAELGVGSVNVNGLEPYSPDILSEPVWTDPDRHEYMPPILEDADRIATRESITLRLPSMRPGPAICPQIHRPIVLADGTVAPCSVLAYRRRSLLRVDDAGVVVEQDEMTEARSFGSVNDRDLKSIWTSPEYRAFRHRVARGDFPSDCRSCLLKHGMICPTPPLSTTECLESLSES